MKNRTTVTGFIAIALSLLYLSAIIISCKDAKEQEYEKEMNGEEEEKGKGPRLTGVEKQLSSWFWEKAYPNPSNLARKYMKAWEEVKELEKNSLLNNPNTRVLGGMGNWTAFGPKVFGGRVLSIAINPTAAASGNNTIYIGSASGGIWRSYTNGVGATAWHYVETNKPILGVSSIVYHPTDTSTLLAGTGEVYRVQTLSSAPYSSDQVGNIGRSVWKARGTYGIGILKSTDAGATWTHVMVADTQALFGVQKIKYHPTNTDSVFACTTTGLYLSEDGGDTWANLWPAVHVTDVVVNPSNTQQIVVAAGNVDNASKGLWRSTDGGASFTKLTFAATTLPDSYARFKGFATLSLAGTNTIFAGFGNNDTDGNNSYNETEIYRSTDFGVTWQVISNSNHAEFQAWFSHCITPFPGVTNKLFMAGVGKHVLSISGSTGTKTTVGGGGASMGSYLTPGSQEGGSTYVHSDVHDIKFIPGSSSIAYFATDGGIFRTTNANASPISGMTFNSCNGGLQIHQFYPTVAQSATNANLFIGGLQDNNVIRYNGTGWARIIGGDGGPCMFKPGNDNVVLMSRDTRYVAKSINAGASTANGNDPDNGASHTNPVLSYLGTVPVGNDDRTSFMSPIGVSANNPERFYAGSDNLHVSTNGGSTFTGNGIPGTTYIEARNKTALSIGVAPTDANRLFVSLSPFAQNVTTSSEALHYNPPATIRRSTDGGTNFTTVITGLPDRLFTDFAISPTNADSVFVTVGGFGTSHIYVSGDNGSNWTPRSSGLPDLPFNTIIFDPANTSILYAGSDFGVWVSNDRGANWWPFNGGFWDATYVIDMVMAPGNKVRAITHGKGIFEADRWNGIISTLPVNFRSFTGINRGTYNELAWNVDQESNLSHYVLERSTDGFSYQAIKQVTARNSTAPTSYSYQDMIGTNPSPVYYYRVRSVNLDGSYMYSEVVMIKISNKGKFEVLGNPFYNTLTIRYTVAQTAKLQLGLYDMQGKLIRREEVLARNGTSVYTMQGLSAIPAGIYLLNMEMDRNKTVLKVVKR